MSRPFTEQLTDPNSLESLAKRLRSLNKKIISTNGCFDILHLGHVRYLKEAKSLGDVLVIGVNSDASVRTIKGPARPIQPELARAEILASLECVDYVCIFNESTPEDFLRRLRPDIHVKGGDWEAVEIPERKVVESFGGKVKFLKFSEGYSTTQILNAVLEKNSKPLADK